MSNGLRISPLIEIPPLKKPYISSNYAIRVISLVPNPTLRRKGFTVGLLSRESFKGEIHLGNHDAAEGHSQDLHNLPGNVVELLQPISSETQFHQVISEAQHLDKSVVIVWMATWCRKCIYLKPKLEKLAAEYYPRIGFYCIDVNNVSHKLVARAGVTKMPTIQVWKDGEKLEEVIGGHKAHLVVNEIRQMIENEDAL